MADVNGAGSREWERISGGFERSAVASYLTQLTGDLGRSVRREPAKPCGRDRNGVSRWAVVACPGEPVDLLGWTTVYVPADYVALDASRHDVHRATRRWLLPISNPHEPRVLFGGAQREFGIPKFLVSTCPVQTADLCLTAIDKASVEWRSEGKDVVRDTVTIGRLSVERFVYRYRPTPPVDPHPTTLACFWVTYSPRGPFVVQADIPDFTPADETVVETFMGCAPAAALT
jgi:hypothetical protein